MEKQYYLPEYNMSTNENSKEIRSDIMVDLIEQLIYSIKRFHEIHSDGDLEQVKQDIAENISSKFREEYDKKDHLLDIYRLFGDLFEGNKVKLEFFQDIITINYDHTSDSRNSYTIHSGNITEDFKRDDQEILKDVCQTLNNIVDGYRPDSKCDLDDLIRRGHKEKIGHCLIIDMDEDSIELEFKEYTPK